uniref:Uncharacterized protein n=2 Tax=Oryza TaxID=4527 RepID=A0A0E0P6W6_ORYRU
MAIVPESLRRIAGLHRHASCRPSQPALRSLNQDPPPEPHRVWCSCAHIVTKPKLRDTCEEVGLHLVAPARRRQATGKPRGFVFCRLQVNDVTSRSTCRNGATSIATPSVVASVLRIGLGDGCGGGELHEPVGIEDATHAASHVKGVSSSATITTDSRCPFVGLSQRHLWPVGGRRWMPWRRRETSRAPPAA